MGGEAEGHWTGGCQCGAVRYRIAAEGTYANLCHCRMCQKASGGPFMAFVNLPVSGFALTRGAIAWFASSNIAERGFCAHCGTPLTYRAHGAERMDVTAGSLDDPNAIEPKLQIGIEAKVAWLDRALALDGVSTDDFLARRRIARVESHQHPDQET